MHFTGTGRVFKCLQQYGGSKYASYYHDALFLCFNLLSSTRHPLSRSLDLGIVLDLINKQ